MANLLPRTFAAGLPVKNQCQAPIFDRQHRIHQCPNTAKDGRRYCRTHSHFGLPRTAWDDSKEAAIR